MNASRRSGLRIGIDGSCLGSGRGYGRYLRELLPPLLEVGHGHEFVLVVDRATAAKQGPFPTTTLEPKTRVAQASAASARGNRSLADMWSMGRAVAKERFDVMFFPSVYSYFPVFGGRPILVCMHDVIPERYGDLVFPARRNRWLWNAKVAIARRQADALLTVSEWSRRALAEHFRLDAKKIHVSIEAPGPEFSPVASRADCEGLLEARGIARDARYLLYVGGFNPHKNLKRLIDALRALEGHRDLQLLLVGDFEGDVFHAPVEALRAEISAAGLEERVHLLGFVPDAELRHLYAGAIALVLPSLEEGFGLPAVEAAACGTPCLATRNSPLPDLLEGGGLFVDPTDTKAMRAALELLLGDAALRDRLGRRALEAANKLSWRDTATQTLAVLERVAR